jgi:hypothetical protein
MPRRRIRPRPVFINCPFDDAYTPIFHAIVFTVVRCGFKPRCALEIDDGAGTRIDKILRLIRDCPISIHDLCRTELDAATNLPRFNMPFELGLFLGARHFGDRQQRRKRCLIFDSEPYRYRNFISDIAGQDIRAHNHDASQAIARTRHFLNAGGHGALPGPAIIQADYSAFRAALPMICEELGPDPADFNYSDLLNLIAYYLEARA